MKDKVELLHRVREELERLVDESGSGFGDLITGIILGVGIADKIVSGEIFADTENDPEKCALCIVTAIALVDVMPEPSLERIEKALS